MPDTKDIPPRINRGAKLFRFILWIVLGGFLAVQVFFTTTPANQASPASVISKGQELAAAAAKGPYASFDDLARFDGQGVGAWYEKEGVVEISGVYLRLEPDVYRALRFVATSGSLTVDSVAVYERVRRLRELREELGKK